MRKAARRVASATLAVWIPGAAIAAELVVAWERLRVPVEGYQVERRVADARDEFEPIARVDAGATRFTDRAVRAGVRYCYRVRGVRGTRTSPPSPPLCNVATEPTAESAEQTPIAAEPQSVPEARTAPESQAPIPAEQPGRAEAELPAQTSAATPAKTAAVPGVQTQVLAAAESRRQAATPAPVQIAAESPSPAPPPGSQFREVKALSRPPPAYPSFAQLNGISGWVKLMFTVSADGRTRDIRVTAAEPPGVFDQAATTAATRFVYSPRVENGVPVDRPNVETEITFTWIDRGGSLTTGRTDRRRPPR